MTWIGTCGGGGGMWQGVGACGISALLLAVSSI